MPFMIDRRLENLQKIRSNHASLGERVESIERELRELEEKSEVMENILNSLREAAPGEVSTG